VEEWDIGSKVTIPWLTRRRGEMERLKKRCMVIWKIIKTQSSAVISCLSTDVPLAILFSFATKEDPLGIEFITR